MEMASASAQRSVTGIAANKSDSLAASIFWMGGRVTAVGSSRKAWRKQYESARGLAESPVFGVVQAGAPAANRCHARPLTRRLGQASESAGRFDWRGVGEFVAHCTGTQRSMSQSLIHLLTRGIEAYEEDGVLVDTRPKPKPGEESEKLDAAKKR